MKILIIEDERELAANIATYLKEENYICEFAGNYNEAIVKTGIYDYDCILLDLMLPDGDGLKVLEALRKEHKQDGVIIISAKDAIEDKITGLKLGADDYLAKPFHLPELGARIYSIIRRKHFGSSNCILANDLYVDLLAKTVYANDRLLSLTKKEFDLLLFLLKKISKKQK